MPETKSRFQWSEAYRGASWVRVDLHLHTPGVHSFKLPAGSSPERDREQIAGQYVRQLATQGIQVAAITDYQNVRTGWFTLIRDKAQEQGIVIFPGAELSFKGPKHGLHILIVFSSDTDLAAINRAIQALDRNSAQPLIHPDGSHRDIDPQRKIEDALLDLRRQFNPLPLFIIPHPNDSNGLLKSYSPQDAAEFIRGVRPEAVEGFSTQDIQRLSSTAVLKKSDLRGIASVQFSDPKRIEDIGTKQRPDGTPRATFLKLSVTDDLDAIRMALHDPEILVHTGERPEIGYTHLMGLEVDGDGFLGDLALAFSPELNALVGGRGVGKSAILETIRYTLDITPYTPTEYRENLVRYALGSGGKASLYLEQAVGGAARSYRIERVWGEAPRVFELEPERAVALSPLDILGDRESPLFFGQREIYQVSRDESKRLRLLDEIIGREAYDQLKQVRKLEQQLRDNARQILERRQQLEEEEEIEHRLKEIEHEIELYRREGLAEKLAEATTLTADEQRLHQAEKAIQEAIKEWDEIAAAWAIRWQSPMRQLGEAGSSQKALLQEAQEILQTLQANLDDVFRQGKTHLSEAQKRTQDLLQRWEQARRPLDEELRQVKQAAGNSSLDPDRLIQITDEQTRLEPQLRLLQNTHAEVKRSRQERRRLLEQLQDARREAWRLRSRQAQALTNKLQGRVRVKVEYQGQKNKFADRLVAFFQGSGVDQKNIERLATLDGATIAGAVRADDDKLVETFHVTPGRAGQIHSYLSQDESRLFDLEILAPEDAVRVYLRINETEHPLEKLSDGQRATAMLLLLLVQEERTLLVDQPEDDLDNRFIYEDIVRILREQKGFRQALSATHNPNIPVLGYAELIVALDATEKRSTISAQGSVDRAKVGEFVKDVMEGGEDAFRRRAEKYGWL